MAAASATVKGGFWEQNGGSPYTQASGRGDERRRVALWLGKKGTLSLRAKLNALIGAAAGGAAVKTYARIANAVELGGKRTIETENLGTAATTAGDVAELKADLTTLTTRTSFGASPPANKDLNPLGTR